MKGKGQPNINYAKIPNQPLGGNPAYHRQETMPDHNSQPLITQAGSNSSMAEFLSGIPDPAIRSFVSDIAKTKIAETHIYLDWVSKALHHLSNNCQGFLDRLNNHLRTSNKMIETLKAGYAKST